MRVSDGICDIARVASRAKHAASRALPKGRRKRDHSGSLGKIEFVQVFQAEDGQNALRFLLTPKEGAVIPGIDAYDIQVWDSHGLSLDASATLLNPGEVRRNPKQPALVSVRIPAGVRSFYAGNDSFGVAHVGSIELLSAELRRNSRMVNPGIDHSYKRRIARYQRGDAHGEAHASQTGPKFSIITPLYKTPIGFFDAMLGSIEGQTYKSWELVLVNASPEDEALSVRLSDITDPKVKIVSLEQNEGISKNTLAGIEVSTGDFLCFLDHDDMLAPNALAEYASYIESHPGTDLLYCDEDSISADGGAHFNPVFKADLNLDILLSYNSVCHFLAISRHAYDQVMPYDSNVDGAQDWDLTLKALQVSRHVGHVPKVLYHWRNHEDSTNGGDTDVKPYVIESSANALRRFHASRGAEVDVQMTDYPCVFRTTYPKSVAKDVCLIVRYADALDLARFAASLEGQREEVISKVCAIGPALAESDELTEEIMHELSPFKLEFHAIEDRAGIAAEMDSIVKSIDADYVLFADAKVRFVDGNDCVGELRDLFCRDDIGIASAKSLTLDGLNLHVGLCVKEDGSFGFMNQSFTPNMGGGYGGYAESLCDYSAIDGSCFMIPRELFQEVGGFSSGFDSDLAMAVDLSFKVRERGLLVMVDPYAMVQGDLSVADAWIGKDHLRAGSKDNVALWEKWEDSGFRRDVLFNPNVDLSTGYPRLK